MLVYEEFFVNYLTLRVRGRGWAGMDHGPLTFTLQPVAVVDRDIMTIHHGVRVLDHVCHRAMTSDWHTDSTCASWRRIASVLELQPVSNWLWVTELTPPMTLDVLRREFSITITAEWMGLPKFWEPSRVMGVYTTAHAHHIHLLMNTLSLLDGGWPYPIRNLADEINAMIMYHDPLYERASRDELELGDLLDQRALESSFRGVLGELLAVRQVDVYPVGG